MLPQEIIEAHAELYEKMLSEEDTSYESEKIAVLVHELRQDNLLIDSPVTLLKALDLVFVYWDEFEDIPTELMLVIDEHLNSRSHNLPNSVDLDEMLEDLWSDNGADKGPLGYSVAELRRGIIARDYRDNGVAAETLGLRAGVIACFAEGSARRGWDIARDCCVGPDSPSVRTLAITAQAEALDALALVGIQALASSDVTKVVLSGSIIGALAEERYAPVLDAAKDLDSRCNVYTRTILFENLQKGRFDLKPPADGMARTRQIYIPNSDTPGHELTDIILDTFLIKKEDVQEEFMLHILAGILAGKGVADEVILTIAEETLAATQGQVDPRELVEALGF